MARVKLTKSVVANLPVPDKAQAFIWDSVLKGFGVRVSRAGVKTYIVQFKVRGGKERRMAVGRCDRVALDTARREASQLISAADLGGDPAVERREAKNVSEDQNPLFRDFSTRWLEDVAKRKNRDSTLKHRRLLLDNHVLPQLGNKRLTEITQRQIEDMHHKVSKKFPVAANRTVSLCSAIFTTAIRWGLVSENPALTTRVRFPSPAPSLFPEKSLPAICEMSRASFHTLLYVVRGAYIRASSNLRVHPSSA